MCSAKLLTPGLILHHWGLWHRQKNPQAPPPARCPIPAGACLETLPLFLDELMGHVMNIVVSVTAVLFFGEIIPQAVCVRCLPRSEGRLLPLPIFKPWISRIWFGGPDEGDVFHWGGYKSRISW